MRNERFKIFGVRGGQASASDDCGRSDHRVGPKAACSTDGVKESSRFDGLHLFESEHAAGKKTADNLNVAARDRATEELIPSWGRPTSVVRSTGTIVLGRQILSNP